MASSEINGAKSAASHVKVAQLHAAIKDQLDIEYFERILLGEGSINENKTKAVQSLLHAAYDRVNEFAIYQLLVSHGADITARNSGNHTVVHRIIHENYSEPQLSSYRTEKSYVDSILSAHVKFENTSNPRCDYGISHFHAACLTNHVECVEFFLKNGAAVDESVSENSLVFAGFTPLHFAVRYSCLETAEILLKYGANVNLKNSRGLTALALLLQRKINEDEREVRDKIEKILKIFIAERRITIDCLGLSNLHVACALEDISVVKSILADGSSDVNHSVNMDAPIYPGYTPLHFAAICNINTVTMLLEKGADVKAKDANNVKPIDLCLRKHAVEDIHYIISSETEWKNIKLSDCKTRLVDFVSAMKSDDEFRKFLENLDSIDLSVPATSSLWPGYTILHFAVIFSERPNAEYFRCTSDTKKVEYCLTRGAEVTKTDADNSTALHLAFHLQKLRTVELLLQHHAKIDNSVDNSNLSHLHIACAARDATAVRNLLSSGCSHVNLPIASTLEWCVRERTPVIGESAKVFLAPGSTPLHVNVACGDVRITRMLLEHGADIYAKDCNGFTAVHRLFTACQGEEINGLLLKLDGLRDSIADCGLSHLHVACYDGDRVAIEKLLENGADVNAVVNYKGTVEFSESETCLCDPYAHPSMGSLCFLSCYDGFTPLHFCIDGYNTDLPKLLIQRGVDVLAGSSRKCGPLQKIFDNAHSYDEIILPVLMSNDALRDRLENQLGIEMLHIACYVKNRGLVEDLLAQGQDVNARVSPASPIWPGNTPMHVAALNVRWHEDDGEIMEFFELLLGNGADVTLKNEEGDSPLHLLDRTYDEPLTGSTCAYLLLNSLKDFTANSVDCQGVSFFHFACVMKDVSVVEKFLENGIDVNEPVDYLADRYAGCSPLHLAAGYQKSGDVGSQLKIIGLLLKHGADVEVVDARKNTPLHCAATFGSSREKLFDVFISAGLDVNAENILVETPLEILVKSGSAEWPEIEFLLKHGCRINSYNTITQEGCITKIFNNSTAEKNNALSNDVIRKLVASEYVTEIDNEGRNFLHNLVSTRCFDIEDCVELIEQLVKAGCDINRQDNEGRTALHVATCFRNNQGVLACMKNGADVNVTDKNGKTAFAYSFESPCDSRLYENRGDPDHVINVFAVHVHKMEACGLYVSQANRQLQVDALEMCYLKEDVLNRFKQNIRKAKSIKIESVAMNLFDFGFKIDAGMIYANMPLYERLAIDQFFQNIRQHKLEELDYLLKLKYEKAREKLRYVNLAVVPFGIVTKNELPELCCRIILSFLPIADLKNVIATEQL